MLNVFAKKSVQLSDGRTMPLKDLVRDYERLKSITNKELKPGEWFRIDREIINKSKEEIRHKCNEAGDEGKEYWKRFEESNKIADENPEQYSIVIETYIFGYPREDKTAQKLQDMCEKIGDGMCDEVICDLELQMRICNGESVNDLFKKGDKLEYERVIKFRNGKYGTFGGGHRFARRRPPATCLWSSSNPLFRFYKTGVPYAFRHGLS